VPILPIGPTMLLITKDDLAEATTLLKTKGILYKSHDVIEKVINFKRRLPSDEEGRAEKNIDGENAGTGRS